MRMLASHYAGKAQPITAKKLHGEVHTLLAPLHGLSLQSKGSEGDAMTALVMKNVVIQNDRVEVRAGHVKKTTRGTSPIWHMIPFYGSAAGAMAAASNHEIWNAVTGALVKGGFTSDDWHWTAYSNLGDKDYTVMVNGADGVWSWDGGSAADGPAIAGTNLTAAAEAVLTCATATLANGMKVVVSGADTAHAAANGPQVLKNVGSPAGTVTLAGCNTTSAGSTQASGITIKIAGSMVKETISVDPADSFIAPNGFHIVLAHQNRLFFADRSNLAVYYLPLLQKSGLVAYIPLNNVFKRGGYIKAMYTWTVEGGVNMNDQLVIFTSNGECAIYGGVDPDTDFALSGVFRFDAPMSKHSVVNYGGELYVLVPTGLVPMSTLIKAETDHLGLSEQEIISAFLGDASAYKDSPGWMVALNPSTGRMLCNIPQGSPNKYKQIVRHMPREIWTEFVDLPARCWGWLDPFLYFGDDNGNVYEAHPAHQTDNGKAIRIDVLWAWSRFKTAKRKKFHGVQAYIITDGEPHPVIDVKVDFDYNPGVNVPDQSGVLGSSLWDVAMWDVALWAPGKSTHIIWNGVSPSGTYGAVRITADVNNCYFGITAVDVLFEAGVWGP